MTAKEWHPSYWLRLNWTGNAVNTILISISIWLILPSCRNDGANKVLELWYDRPALIWEEALPIGNGRLGAMVYGSPESEHIQFNEETLWDCGPRDYHREGASEWLDEIRQLLFDKGLCRSTIGPAECYGD